MKKTSYLGKAFIASLLVVLTAPASAKVYNLGDLVAAGSPTAAKPASGTSVQPITTRSYAVRGNARSRFNDVFTFSLSKDADVSLRRFIPNRALGRHVQVRSVIVALHDSDNNLVARLRGDKLATFASRLDDGAYRVRVTGALKPGFARGAYNFGTAAIAAPVPEPEEWALMILGSGLLAYQVRRRRRQLASVDEQTVDALPA